MDKMEDEAFMLVSLKENKAKKLAQVISNDTSRTILEFLTHGKKTESEISKELHLPISTVHYNLKHLVDAKLVTADEFHYSEKGKEVIHYGLANKFIIIAPHSDESVLAKLKKFLPITAVSAAAAGFMSLAYSWIQKGTGVFGASMSMDMAAEKSVRSAPLMDNIIGGAAENAKADVMSKSAPMMQKTATDTADAFMDDAVGEAATSNAEVAMDRAVEEASSAGASVADATVEVTSREIIEETVVETMKTAGDEGIIETTQELGRNAAEEATFFAQERAAEYAPVIVESAKISGMDIAIWMFIGSAVAIVLMALYEIVWKKK